MRSHPAESLGGESNWDDALPEGALGTVHARESTDRKHPTQCATCANESVRPPGFEQSFKDRLLRPNRTQAEIEANRKKHGIVYRDQ